MRAWNFVADRHDALRACFQWHNDDEFTQQFADTITVPLKAKRDIPTDADRDQLVSDFLNADRTCKFNLASAPLWRLTVFLWNNREATTVWTFHHSLLDGRSHTLVWQEVDAVYRCLLAQTVPELPPARSFREFASWLKAASTEPAAAYWRKRLHGFQTSITQPSLSSEEDSGSDKSPPAMETLTLTAAAASQLHEAALRHGVTLNNLVQAAWALVLSQGQEEEEIVFGVVRSGRHWTDEDPDSRIGMFINTIPFRVDTSHSQPVGVWLQSLRTQQLDARVGEHASAEQIRRWCGLPSSTALFRTLLMFENRDSSALLTNTTQRVRLIEKTDLLALAVFSGTALVLNLNYSPLRLSPVQARTVLEKIHTILEALAAASNDLLVGQLPTRLPADCRRIIDEWQGRSKAQSDQFNRVLDGQGDSAQCAAETPLLTEAERHQILVEWNATEREYPLDKCVHELFEEQVVKTPEAIAVVFESQSLTYRELNQRANQLAHYLRKQGVGPESLVGLFLERSLEMVIAIYGVMKSGGAYIPIDPAYPSERITIMLANAKPAVILTQEKLKVALPASSATLICLDSAWEQLKLQNDSNPEINVCAGSLIYVIYTSGSTGQPKGAMNTHQGVCNRMLWMQEAYVLTSNDSVLQKTPYSFDVSVWEFMWPLLNGARLIVARPNGHRDTQYLLETINRFQITTIHFVPSMLRLFLQEINADYCKSLRRVICSGEALTLDCQQMFFEHLPGTKLYNLYGPTEAAVDVTHWTCRPDCNLNNIPIGRPISNIQIYLLNEAHEPIPVGNVGELYIGGIGVARGYLNQPELTAERFIPNLFSSKPGSRLYRTGDLARWLPDGNIEYLGRSDFQVKIRGFRIELGEIEAQLNQHAAVSASAVATEGEGVDKAIVAYLVGRPDKQLSASSLRDWLAARLPEYMMPARFVQVAALPININGKLDRKALAQMDGKKLETGTEYAAPRNPLEQELVTIWESILRHQPIGIHDSFFHLGGHSLLAVALCSQINRKLGQEMSLRWVFEHPTIERLAARMALSADTPQNLQPIAKADRQMPLPMSFAQQRMWLLQQTQPDAAAYNVPVAWHLSGRVKREKIHRALQTILERHEVLRSALLQQGDQLVQQLASAKALPSPWQEIDLQTVLPEQKEEVLAEKLLEEVRRPFNLGQAPLWRAAWIELGGDEQALVFTFHHSIVDEWSLRLFSQELERLYAVDSSIELADLPELPVQYGDYAVWQRERLSGELHEQHRRYWQQQLQNLPPPLELPTDFPRPVSPSGRGAIHHFQLEGPVPTKIRALAQEENTTLFTVLLAAFQVLLHRYTGQPDIIVGTPIADRKRFEFHSLLGFFLNTLPIRARLAGHQSFQEVLGEMRKTLLEAFTHFDLPFDQIVALTFKERVTGQQPLYQVMFVLLEEDLQPLRLDQAQSRLLPISTGTSKSDLTLRIQAVGGAWHCQLEYSTDLFTENSMASMARHLTEMLRSITENPQVPISQLNLMQDAERHQILVEWNATEREYPLDKCVHELFEEQVERTPEAMAVECNDKRLTYRSLNERANQLAHLLKSLGVGPETIVGICVDRSLDMVVALLGVLKAGGALVPIDPDLPRERIKFIVADAQMQWVVTQTSLLEKLPQTNAQNICLDQEFTPISDDRRCAVIDPRVKPGNLAYVVYTSGSTGRPKGVLITHEAYLNHFSQAIELWQYRASDRVLQFASFSFDVSIDQILTPLLAGATVVLRGAELWDPALFTKVIVDNRLTVVHLPPPYWQKWVEHMGKEKQGKSIGQLRQVQAGGDVMPLGTVRKWQELKLGSVRLFNRYGPTETTLFSTAYEVPMEQPAHSSATRIPIGRPVGHRTIYILDAHGSPVPIGIAGEMHIGGKTVARGYLNRPELTAERFIPNPFCDEAGARLYKTGDLARYRVDGNIEFLGRMDQQVKIRGYRIELGEIETVLGCHPEISACAVVAQADENDGKVLVAFVVGRKQAELTVGPLRTWLAEKLPEYMIPSRFVMVSALPLNPNGKLDRKALGTMGGEALATGTEYTAPRNALEQQLATIWQTVLRRERVGIQDNFFHLGGHSLLVAQLTAEIDKQLKFKIPIATLFQTPTIESLTRRIVDENWAPPWSSLVPLQPQGSKPPLFFVHGWGGDVFVFLELTKHLPPDQPVYGIQAVGLDGKTPRHITIEEMASHYIKEIISFQPTGPIYLGGFSMGGVIAYEVAQQLHRLGRRVALLALLDSNPTGKTPWVFYGFALGAYIPKRCWAHFRHWWQLPFREQSSYIRGRWMALLHWAVRNRKRPPIVTISTQETDDRLKLPPGSDYYRAVAHTYELRPYPGSADIFISDEFNSGWKLYWRHLVLGGVSFHQVSGGHEEILLSKDQIAKTAAALMPVLNRAQNKESANLTPGDKVKTV